MSTSWGTYQVKGLNPITVEVCGGSVSGLQYFGYYAGFDPANPDISQIQTFAQTTIRDTGPWSNVVFLSAEDWAPIPDSTWSLLAANNMKALVNLGGAFYEPDPCLKQNPRPADCPYDLVNGQKVKPFWCRYYPPSVPDCNNDGDLKSTEDWQYMFSYIIDNNNLHAHLDQIAAFYLPDEAFWGGYQCWEVKTMADAIRKEFPGIPIILIDAGPVFEEGGGEPSPACDPLPENIDWVGFDWYGELDPNNTSSAQYKFFKGMQARVSRSPGAKKMFLVPDGTYGEGRSWSKDQLGTVLLNYEKLAKTDSRVIGLLTYLWGAHHSAELGSKVIGDEIPKVRTTQQQVGRRITGQNSFKTFWHIFQIGLKVCSAILSRNSSFSERKHIRQQTPNNILLQFSCFDCGFTKIIQHIRRICFIIFGNTRSKSGNFVTKVIGEQVY
ncbi:MAG: hypothetical protein HYT37_01710 [Candidatus Sungbacteria bacterium]|nr:hypothetical protein [Candidatus Sungbacteria bacterium]